MAKPKQRAERKKEKQARKQHAQQPRRIAAGIAALLVIALGTTLWRTILNPQQSKHPDNQSSYPPARPHPNAQLDPEVKSLVERHINAVQRNPASADEHGKLGTVYEANELYPEARESFRNAANLAPNQWVWSLHQAAMTTASGAFDAGLTAHKKVATQFPDVPQVQDRLARQLLTSGAIDTAEQAFRRATELAPQACGGFIGLGEIAIQRRDFHQAVNLLEKGIRMCPEYPMAHYLLGLAYRRVGREDEARRELAIGAGASPKFMTDPVLAEIPKYYRGLAVQLDTALKMLDAGKITEAIQLLEKAREKRPRDINVLNNLSIAYQNAGNPAKSRDILLETIQVDPNQFPTYINLVEAYLALNEPQKALPHGIRAAELAPTVGQAHFAKARALMNLDRYEEAREALKDTVRLDSRNPEAFMMLAECCYRMGDVTEAQKQFVTAAERLPRNLMAQVNACVTSMKVGKWNDAQKTLRQAKLIAPNHPKVQTLQSDYDKNAPQ
jgi:tetratricopeptide (TPR) repeat protein